MENQPNYSNLYTGLNLLELFLMLSKKGEAVEKQKIEEQFSHLVNIVRTLRVECPWDREQSHESIRHSLIEEAYEVVESIDRKSFTDLKQEIGDILLHVVLHAIMAEEKNAFTLEEVLSGITEKLVRRHPHVFGNAELNTPHEVKTNWEKMKLDEGRASVVDGVPKELPALLRAARIQEKVSKVGFDWEKKEDVWKKIVEEIEELHRAEHRNNKEEIEEELGDLLFSLVNYSRFLQVNPELALRSAIVKFVGRFKKVEESLQQEGKSISEATLKEMDDIWNSHKNSAK